MLLMASVVRARQRQRARLLVITVCLAFGQPLKLVNDLELSARVGSHGTWCDTSHRLSDGVLRGFALLTYFETW